MYDLRIAGIERHQRFVKRVVAAGSVWVLQHRDERGSWATSCVSFEGEDGEEVEVPIIPFWSDRAYAARCAKGPWSVYQPRALDLELFLDRVLHDFHQRGLMVGTNWNGDLVGHETTPLDLARELNDAIENAADDAA